MIAYLKGLVKYIGPNWLILDVNGVGYNVKLKTNNEKLKTNEIIELFIYHHIREDRSELYGFTSMEELQVFEMLLEVNGVGPKMAQNILEKAEFSKIKNAIAKGDSSFFLSISGVGKKLATKIILELKNKISDSDFDILNSSDLSTDLLDAMESLGYKKSEIYPHIGKIPDNIDTTEKKVKWLLKNMQK